MKEKNITYGVGANFFELLTVVFITLKLTHIIEWSWWWVLSPLWIPALIAFVIVMIYIIGDILTS